MALKIFEIIWLVPFFKFEAKFGVNKYIEKFKHFYVDTLRWLFTNCKKERIFTDLQYLTQHFCYEIKS